MFILSEKIRSLLNQAVTTVARPNNDPKHVLLECALEDAFTSWGITEHGCKRTSCHVVCIGRHTAHACQYFIFRDRDQAASLRYLLSL